MFKMKRQFLTGVVVMLLSLADFSYCKYCTDYDPNLRENFCNTETAKASIVYLDSFEIHKSDVGECTCKISAVMNTLITLNISNAPTSNPGGFRLVVGGQKVELPVSMKYMSPVNITLRKPEPIDVIQCIRVAGEFDVDNGIFNTECFTRRDILPKTEASMEASASTGDDSSSTGVIVGATMGGIAVIIAVVVLAVIIIRRKRNGQSSSDEPQETNYKGKDPNYEMTVHEGYVSADADKFPEKREQHSVQEYEDINATKQTVSDNIIIKYEQPSIKVYEDIDDIKRGSGDKNKERNETKHEHIGHYEYATTNSGKVTVKGAKSGTHVEIVFHDNVSPSFAPTNHDEVGYTVVNKSSKAQDKTAVGNVENENEYNVINTKKVIPPTGNIYGVAIPIQAESKKD